MSQPWMPLYVADYLGDTGHLTTLEHGAYLLLLMHYWRNGALPTDDVSLAAITKLPTRDWKQMSKKINALFKAGPWTHKRVEQELDKAARKGAARADAGRRGGQASAAAKTEQPPSKRQAIATAFAPPLPQQTGEQTSTDVQASSSQSESKPASVLAEPLSALAEFRKGIVAAFRNGNSPNFPDTSRASLWIAQGYDSAICLAVIGELVRKKPDISTLSYFDKAIADAHRDKPKGQSNGHAAEKTYDLGAGVEITEANLIAQIKRPSPDWRAKYFGPDPAFRQAVERSAPQLMPLFDGAIVAAAS